MPGLGHPVHKDGDPRTPVLVRIAEEEGLRGPHLRLFEAVGRTHEQVLGRRLPLNGAGVFYGGSASEAAAMAGRDVYVVGGANSAGQAALHLSEYARR